MRDTLQIDFIINKSQYLGKRIFKQAYYRIKKFFGSRKLDMLKTENNLIRIGKKPLMSYVVACVTLFNSGINKIIVRARGRAITKAVDVVEMLRRSFFKGLIVNSIEVGSDDFKFQGRDLTVSTIEIILTK